MVKNLIARASASVYVSKEKVWKALVAPEAIHSICLVPKLYPNGAREAGLSG